MGDKWSWWDLNPRLPPCKGGALPLSYSPKVLEADLKVIVTAVGMLCNPGRNSAKLSEGSLQFLGGGGSAMELGIVLHEADPLALDGMGDDAGWLCAD